MVLTIGKVLIAILFLLLVDAVWLGTVGQYALAMTARIQGSAVAFRFGAAAVVYVALALLLLQATSVSQAALIGAASYAVYDFTNYALLKDYDIRIAVADTLWGGALFAIVYTVMDRVGALN
jgi:uncharacterized membrane protein